MKNCRRVFITPDQTFKERQANKKLREELSNMPDSDDFMIRRGQIVRKPEVLSTPTEPTDTEVPEAKLQIETEIWEENTAAASLEEMTVSSNTTVQQATRTPDISVDRSPYQDGSTSY